MTEHPTLILETVQFYNIVHSCIETPLVQIMNDWLAGSASQDESAAPPRDIPEKLLPQYTMNGYAVLDHSIVSLSIAISIKIFRDIAMTARELI